MKLERQISEAAEPLSSKHVLQKKIYLQMQTSKTNCGFMEKETRANDLGFLGTIGDHSKRLTGSICHPSNYQKESYITQITYFGFI